MAVLCTAVLAACVTHPEPSTAEGRTSGPQEAFAPVHTALRVVTEAMRGAEAAWPGFDKEPGAIIAVIGRAGPIYVLGDTTLAAGYSWLDRSRAIATREGPPPDSLQGLRIAFDWNGRPAHATLVELSPATLPHTSIVLVHEAFHSHQRRAARLDRTRWRGRENPRFPTDSDIHLALLYLESIHLARALTAAAPDSVHRSARLALAVRASRCTRLGEAECDRQRAMELIEGSASYVASVLLDRRQGGRDLQATRDSLAQELVTVRDMSHVERDHYYTSGHAWLLLLEQLGAAGWKEQVERTSPDRVLAEEVMRLQPGDVVSLVNEAFNSPEWDRARLSASTVVRADVARRDSTERAFWALPGIPVRISFGPVRQLGTATGGLPGGRKQFIYTFGTNRVVVRGDARDHCCGPGVVTIAPVEGRFALVDGRRVALDSVGVAAIGAVEIDIPELTMRMSRAQVTVYRDSVAIRAVED